MPKLYVYSVHDTKVGAFAQPFFMRSRGEALRGWEDHVNDSSVMPNKHPQDFALFELASFDEDTGTFENLPAPLNLGLALQFRKAPQAPTPMESAIHQIKEKAVN